MVTTTTSSSTRVEVLARGPQLVEGLGAGELAVGHQNARCHADSRLSHLTKTAG